MSSEFGYSSYGYSSVPQSSSREDWNTEHWEDADDQTGWGEVASKVQAFVSDHKESLLASMPRERSRPTSRKVRKKEHTELPHSFTLTLLPDGQLHIAIHNKPAVRESRSKKLRRVGDTSTPDARLLRVKAAKQDSSKPNRAIALEHAFYSELSDLPGIAQLASGLLTSESGRNSFIMEEYQGSLDEIEFMLRKPQGQELVKEVSLQLIYTVKSMHDRGAFHRDLKLDNIFVKDGDALRLFIGDPGEAVLHPPADRLIYPNGDYLFAPPEAAEFIQNTLAGTEDLTRKSALEQYAKVAKQVQAQLSQAEGSYQEVNEFLSARHDVYALGKILLQVHFGYVDSDNLSSEQESLPITQLIRRMLDKDVLTRPGMTEVLEEAQKIYGDAPPVGWGQATS